MLCERNDLLVRRCVDGCDAAAGGGGDAMAMVCRTNNNITSVEDECSDILSRH
jgi:hypothetical protein